ncbi:unnamed protein product [Polarella glacialis]|uniref:Uncharacterized protein n=1 Tax=Polarella glacialis TaxID=89957 RepID=A0A813IBT3_POLGL|nr:unnamed protein product [Polarella glacialis]
MAQATNLLHDRAGRVRLGTWEGCAASPGLLRSSSNPNCANAAVLELNRESQSLPVNCMGGMAWAARYVRLSVVQKCDVFSIRCSSKPNFANAAVLELNHESQSLPVNCMGGMAWAARYLRLSVVQKCDVFSIRCSSNPNSTNAAVFELNRESQSLPVKCMGGMAWAARYVRFSVVQKCDVFSIFSSSSPNSAKAAVLKLNRESLCAVTAVVGLQILSC